MPRIKPDFEKIEYIRWKSNWGSTKPQVKVSGLTVFTNGTFPILFDTKTNHWGLPSSSLQNGCSLPQQLADAVSEQFKISVNREKGAFSTGSYEHINQEDREHSIIHLFVVAVKFDPDFNMEPINGHIKVSLVHITDLHAMLNDSNVLFAWGLRENLKKNWELIIRAYKQFVCSDCRKAIPSLPSKWA